MDQEDIDRQYRRRHALAMEKIAQELERLNDIDNRRKYEAIEKIGVQMESVVSVLGAIWTVIAPNQDPIYPVSIADEYITIMEAARRLNVTETYITNLILKGIKNPKEGWVQGLHYIILDSYNKYNDDCPEVFTKYKARLIRIPWKATMKRLTLFEQKQRKTQVIDLRNLGRKDYERKRLWNGKYTNPARYQERTFTVFEYEEPPDYDDPDYEETDVD